MHLLAARALLVVACSVVVTVTVTACGVDRLVRPAGTACGAYDPPNRVVTELRLERLGDLSARIPRLGEAAIRQEPDQPALVVVFVGPGRDAEIRGGGIPPRALGAQAAAGLVNLCIVAADGSIGLVQNVDPAGVLP